jgi:cell division protein FtsB
MASFGKKKTLRDYFYSRPVIVVLGILFVFLLVSVYGRYTVAREMSHRREVTETEKQELLERKKILEEKVEYLGGERGLEEEIRTHFDVAKEGEKVIILMGEEKKEAPPPPPLPPQEPWYKFW